MHPWERDREASWEEQVWPPDLSSSTRAKGDSGPSLPSGRPRPQSCSSAQEGRVTLEETSQRVGKGDLGLGQGQRAGVSSSPGGVALPSWHWPGQAVSKAEASGRRRGRWPQHTGAGRVAPAGCGGSKRSCGHGASKVAVHFHLVFA